MYLSSDICENIVNIIECIGGKSMNKRTIKVRESRKDALSSINNVKTPTVKAPKIKGKKKKAKTGERKASDVRKAPRSSRSKSARRWKDWRESDGVVSEVTVYKLSKSEKE